MKLSIKDHWVDLVIGRYSLSIRFGPHAADRFRGPWVDCFSIGYGCCLGVAIIRNMPKAVQTMNAMAKARLLARLERDALE